MAGKLKNHLPRGIKFIPWFLLKSPQRQLGYWRTYRTEISGLLSWLFHKPRALQPISICTGIKDRTDNYLKYVLPSILKMDQQDLIEISIFDCGSADIKKLEEEIRKSWKGKLNIQSQSVKFTRSYAFNCALRQATAPLLFRADTDMSLPEDLVAQCNKYVSRRSVWFPVSFYLKEGAKAETTPENGEWVPVGTGMFAATKAQFEAAGGYDERFDTWGGEDWNLWLRFYNAGYLPIRNRCEGLFHHYHTSEKPENYYKEYGI